MANPVKKATLNEPKTIALVDGFDDGHHLTHLRNYARALLQMGHRVIELLPDPEPVRKWIGETCPEHADSIRFYRYEHPRVQSPSWRLRNVYEPLALWKSVGKTIHHAAASTGFHPDLVFFCWLDDYIVGASRLVPSLLKHVFPYPWSGMFFHPWHLRINDGPTRHESVAAERMLRIKACPVVSVLDHGVAERLSDNVRKAVVPFPDESEEDVAGHEVPQATRIHERAGGASVIGLLGNLSKRKGVMSFLDAAERTRDRDWLYVLAGPYGDSQRQTFDADELERLQQAVDGNLPNVLFLGGRIDDETEFNVVVNACDVLYAVYELFAHSSGIITKAALFDIPIVVSRGYYMEECVRDYSLGLAVDEHETDEIIAALACSLDAAAFEQRVGAPGFAEYRKKHSVAALTESFRELIEELD